MKSVARLAVALCGMFAIGGSFAEAQDLPTSWSWTSTGPLITAKPTAAHDIVSVKDASAVYYNGQYIVYASYANTAGAWGMQYLHFTDWSDAGAATPYFLDDNPNLVGYHTAPQIFYFAPQNMWYLIYQSGQAQYSTNSDPTQPQNWTAPKNLFASQPNGLDYWVICDSVNCYAFFCNDSGQWYRASTPIGSFPNGFSYPEVIYSEANGGNLLEADNVYTVEGTGEYLANIECIGPNGHRFFRAMWASSLGGTWQPLGNTLNFGTPFLGVDNVTFNPGVGTWTDDFSSGGAVIDGYDQTDSINLSTLTFLYQGVNPADTNVSYSQLPYQLGLATYTGGGGTCNPTAIVPEMNVGGVWSQESSASVTSTTAVVDLGPQPLTGGSWAWTGPNGFTSTAREIDTIKLSAGANVYTATYTNSCGAKSTQAFTITAPGGSCTPTAIVPEMNVGGVWTQESSATVTSTTAVVDLGPQPLTGGSWSWTGPNGFTSTAREIDGIKLSTGANVYTATYTNASGCKSTQAFTITVSGGSTGSFTLKPSASALSIAQGASGTDTITVNDVSPFAGSVTLAASGLPSGVTAAFGTNPATASSALTLTDSTSAAIGSSTVTITGTSGSLSASTTIALTVTGSTTTTLIANGTYIVAAVNSGSALDDPNSSTTNGTDMIIWAVNDGTNQQWTVTNVSTNVVTLKNVASGQLLDVAGASKTSGALVDQWPANGQTNQEWTVISVAGGAFELTSVNSGLALSVVGGGTANSTGVDQLTYSGATSQQWKFTAY